VQGPLAAPQAVSAGPLATSQAHRRGRSHLVGSDDGWFVLDIDHDRILKLNPVGAEIWKLLSTGELESEIVLKISRKYQANQSRVAEDVRAFRRKINELGLAPANSKFADGPAPARKDTGQLSYPWYGQAGDQRPKPTAWMVFGAFVGLLIFDLILWLFSLRVLCSCVKAWPVWARKVKSNVAGQLCSAVEQASTWYPKQALCLQRSAVTTCILRSRGLAARMVIGLRPIPFLAHAWVELEDSVVNDWRPVSKFYQTITSY
jgi:hypothetical protein